MTTATPEVTSPTAPPARIFRVEVHLIDSEPDAHGQQYVEPARHAFNAPVTIRSSRVYLVEGPLSDEQAQRVAALLLTDPVNQRYVLGASPVAEGSAVIEVHYLPGVMDPVAQSTQDAIAELLASEGTALAADAVAVRTGFRFDLANLSADDDALRRFALSVMANTVVQEIHLRPFVPERFPHTGGYQFRVTHVPIRDLDDEGLRKLSRDGHLFLSLTEMQAVRDYYRAAGREPRDIELETLAQTWSEHCVHKTLKSTIRYTGPSPVPGADAAALAARPGHEVHHDGSITIHNLLKSTVAAATFKLMESDDIKRWCVSVFKDNAGIVRFDDEDAVCIKVETHNHPSAIEPYGGAATGIGGCIRDVMGTGLSARPIANTDTFCVAPPDTQTLPAGVIHPRRVLQQVMAGVRDYGNRMGIPTINGAVWFHPDYLGNPLVFAGCVGLIPLDKCFGAAQPGDRIIALGGATGRDGIHGATFSSAELTDTHADEFAHAVQIGNAITQKKMMDVILQARDAQGGPLFNAITDCGAGGFSSAVGEMGSQIGARVTLETAPLKYAGLSYTEIWISEAQERMVLAVPPDKVDQLRAMCDAENVSMCDLGQFGWHEDGKPDEATLMLTYHGQEVGRMAMHFLHEGIPTPTREAKWEGGKRHEGTEARRHEGKTSAGDLLRQLLAHPNIASKHWIIRQYDHEVQGGSVIKPLVGPQQDGPSDASVIRPKLGSNAGVAIACGLQPGLGEKAPGGDGDSYWMTLAAIDEAVRNAVCVGADPRRIAILDNFCWPKCELPANLATLVRAAEACYDGAIAYRTPFVSGKDSLNNQFTTEDGRVISIPPTLLVTAMGMVSDVTRCRTMDAKKAGHLLLVVGQTTSALGGSHYLAITGDASRDSRIPHVDLQAGPATAAAVADLIEARLVQSAHDCSDGGLLVAAAEMAMAGRLGVDLNLDAMPTDRTLDEVTLCFAETPSRYLLEIAPEQLDAVARRLQQRGIAFGQVGSFAAHGKVTARTQRTGQVLTAAVDDLLAAWRGTLDW
jgi:phosphoribosylformylglycinamidine synthase